MVQETEFSNHSREVLLSRAFLRIIYTTSDRTHNRRRTRDLPEIGAARIFKAALSRRDCPPDVWHSFGAIRPPRGEVQRARVPSPCRRASLLSRAIFARKRRWLDGDWQTDGRWQNEWEKKRWARYLLEEFGETRGRAAATKLLLQRARTKRQLEVRAPPRNWRQWIDSPPPTTATTMTMIMTTTTTTMSPAIAK